MLLKFIGRGSAFNTKEGNTSSFIKKNNTLYLFDCGEDVYKQIKELDLLSGITTVNIFITHLHSDHMGSLSSLIFDIFYSYNFKPNIYSSCENLEEVLKLLSHNGEYNFYKLIPNEKTNVDYSFSITSIPVPHKVEIDSYSFLFEVLGNVIFYSGDTNEVNKEMFDLYKKGEIDEYYQDVCLADYEGNVHTCIKHIKELVVGDLKNNFYCMHLDSSELEKELTINNYKTVKNYFVEQKMFHLWELIKLASEKKLNKFDKFISLNMPIELVIEYNGQTLRYYNIVNNKENYISLSPYELNGIFKKM